MSKGFTYEHSPRFSPIDRSGFSGERPKLLTPDTGGIIKRVGRVANAFEHASDRIVGAMVTNRFPESVAGAIVGGEQGRILGLGRAFWPFFYGLPMELLAASGHPVKKLFEVGPSFEAHLAALNESLQPRRSLAFDMPHIARGAKVSVQAMQTEGLLRKDANYRVQSGENLLSPLFHADLSVSILEAQYDSANRLAKSLFKHSDTVLVGDVLHGLTALPPSNSTKEGDTVAFNTSTLPNKATGFHLDILQEVGSYDDTDQVYQRRYFEYKIATDPQIIHEDRAISYMDTGANQQGVCTIFVDKKTGQEYVQAWGYRPNEGANPLVVRKVFEAEETLHDLYAYTPEWDGNGAMGVLHELVGAASERRGTSIDTLVTTMVPNAEEMSGRLPLSILLRNKKELVERAEKGELRFIGKNKKYKSVDDFLDMVQKDLLNFSESGSGKAKIDEIATFYPPPLLDILASRNRKVISDIRALAA